MEGLGNNLTNLYMNERVSETLLAKFVWVIMGFFLGIMYSSRRVARKLLQKPVQKKKLQKGSKKKKVIEKLTQPQETDAVKNARKIAQQRKLDEKVTQFTQVLAMAGGDDEINEMHEPILEPESQDPDMTIGSPFDYARTKEFINDNYLPTHYKHNRFLDPDKPEFNTTRNPLYLGTETARLLGRNPTYYPQNIYVTRNPLRYNRGNIQEFNREISFPFA